MNGRYYCDEDEAIRHILGVDDFGWFQEIPGPPDIDPKFGVTQTLRGFRFDWFNGDKTIRMFTNAGGYQYQRCLTPSDPDCQCFACQAPKTVERLENHPLYIDHYIADSARNLIFEFETPRWVLDMIKHYGKKETINILKEQAERES